MQIANGNVLASDSDSRYAGALLAQLGFGPHIRVFASASDLPDDWPSAGKSDDSSWPWTQVWFEADWHRGQPGPPMSDPNMAANLKSLQRTWRFVDVGAYCWSDTNYASPLMGMAWCRDVLRPQPPQPPQPPPEPPEAQPPEPETPKHRTMTSRFVSILGALALGGVAVGVVWLASRER